VCRFAAFRGGAHPLGGRLSDKQVQVLLAMRRAGCDTGYAFGLDAAIRWLEAKGILRGKPG
jgi:hypothetical protein